ncbi:MAG: hypothetical protein JNM92_11060 [Zoogloea sp.]|nr:hypothetical protein [Zoogloea sp.]
MQTAVGCQPELPRQPVLSAQRMRERQSNHQQPTALQPDTRQVQARKSRQRMPPSKQQSKAA